MKRGKDMTKTLWSEKERISNFELPSYTRITATKIDEIEKGKMNLYEDNDGNRYIVRYNDFTRRDEFVKIN
jgi:NRPS condensation-like uncharacterized protein